MNLNSQLASAFLSAQSAVMYNATVKYWDIVETKDNEGTYSKAIDLASVKETFKGNPIEQSSRRTMETYGLKEPFEVAITCAPTVGVGLDSIVSYDDTNYYRVINVVTTTTHKLIVLEKWELMEVT